MGETSARISGTHLPWYVALDGSRKERSARYLCVRASKPARKMSSVCILVSVAAHLASMEPTARHVARLISGHRTAVKCASVTHMAAATLSLCTRHGRCHPVRGNCTCDEGWWSPTCAKPCQCFSAGALSATCDQLTGGCQCQVGHWGQKCSLSCNCYMSQCNQRTGMCDCQEGWWGPTCDRRCNCDLTHSRCDPLNGQCLCLPGYKGVFCNQPCEDGKYDSGCKMSCGYCKDGQPCSPVDGLCADCEPGWHGPRCDRPCPIDYYGEGCLKKCPKCKRGDTCDPRTGDCWKCNPGWAGPRCEEICSDMTYGDACRFLCGPCFHGNCHHVTGRCVCQPGFQGESCNSSCPASQYGLNCSSACDCGEGVSCDPATGACLNSGRGAILAGVLVPVFLLLLAVLCCCLCCGEGPTDGKDRVDDGGTSVRMKHHVYNVLANISASLPCASAWSSGLPRVTVSHHDPELTFNHSFIEPPSCGWVTEGSSFESDEEEGEALYCVPPREDIPAVAGGEFQEMSSKCNMFLDPSGFSSEDMSLPFAIPRTSSIAKSKRPSVSFAEGTRFSSKERCGSAQDLGAPPGPPRTKPKSPWGVLMISALQGSAARSTEEGGVEGVVSEEEDVDGKGGDNHELSEAADHEANRYSAIPCRATPQVPGAAGRRRTMSNTAARKGAQVPASAPEGGHTAEPAPDKITTVYVTVGKAGKPISKVEATSEGPVQAMLRRLGSIQRQKDQETSRPKAKVAEGITKPPRRKLGARASVWEEGGPSGEVIMRKPSRKKHSSANVNGTVGANDSPPSEDGVPKRPLSILKSVPEVTLADTGSQVTAVAAGIESDASEIEHNESRHLTIKPGTDGESLSEVIANEGVMTSMNDEPSYENVMIKHL